MVQGHASWSHMRYETHWAGILRKFTKHREHQVNHSSELSIAASTQTMHIFRSQPTRHAIPHSYGFESNVLGHQSVYRATVPKTVGLWRPASRPGSELFKCFARRRPRIVEINRVSPVLVPDPLQTGPVQLLEQPGEFPTYIGSFQVVVKIFFRNVDADLIE